MKTIETSGTVTTSIGDLGYTAIAYTDLVTGYSAGLITFLQDREFYIGLIPKLYFDVLGQGQLTVKAPYIELTLIANFKAFRFTPFDITIAKGVRDRALCYGVDWTREALDAQLWMETKVYECSTGLAGWIETKQYDDCVWKTYAPQIAVWDRSLLPRMEKSRSWIDWRCSN